MIECLDYQRPIDTLIPGAIEDKRARAWGKDSADRLREVTGQFHARRGCESAKAECKVAVDVQRCGTAGYAQSVGRLIHGKIIECLTGDSAVNSLSARAIEVDRAYAWNKSAPVVGPVTTHVHRATVTLQCGSTINLDVCQCAARDERARLNTQQTANGQRTATRGDIARACVIDSQVIESGVS